MRAFLALDTPETLRAELAAAQGALKSLDILRAAWPRPDTLHLTLHFLGDISDEQAEAVGEGLPACSDGAGPILLAIAGGGVFGHPPRVAWVGLRELPERLLALHERLGRLCRGCGVETESRPWRPHFTLARIKAVTRPEAWAARQEALEHLSLGVHPATEFRLYRSELRPSGAHHRLCQSALL